MKFKYIGDAMITLKSPCPVTGQSVDLHTGDTVELDWKPGGHPQTLVRVEEEAVVEEAVVEEAVVEEAPTKVTQPVTTETKPKRTLLGRTRKDK